MREKLAYIVCPARWTVFAGLFKKMAQTPKAMSRKCAAPAKKCFLSAGNVRDLVFSSWWGPDTTNPSPGRWRDTHRLLAASCSGSTACQQTSFRLHSSCRSFLYHLQLSLKRADEIKQIPTSVVPRVCAAAPGEPRLLIRGAAERGFRHLQ